MEKEMATEMTMKGVSVYLRKGVGPERPWQVIIKNKNQDARSSLLAALLKRASKRRGV